MDPQIDKSDMGKVLAEFPEMIRDAMELARDINIEDDIENIFICGMGGSAFSGDLLKCYLQNFKIPVFINKNYSLPKYVNSKTLLFAVSYSGNTEETISQYREGIRRKAKIVSISSGGKLKELAAMNKNPHVLVPKGIQPRLSTPFLFVPMLTVLQNIKLIPNQKKLLLDSIDALENPIIKDRAQELASKIKNKIPIIYSSDRIYCIAEKWKCDINENAKTPAFYNLFPEFNHNEINGYVNLVGTYFAILIRDLDDHERVKKRIGIIKKLILSKGVEVTEIAITGNSYLIRLLSGIYMGLWVSYHLALEYNVDPTPVEIIEDLKKELAR
ncbi:bifunctional phosphoglucose/phosphomannose isomerase [Candidatus Woesearchaeota archaeon]|nr:bifunctional phosphoglucose/phosphomannose isomerase [Candidatus Woesearchaeota archaeon]